MAAHFGQEKQTEFPTDQVRYKKKQSLQRVDIVGTSALESTFCSLTLQVRVWLDIFDD